MNFVTVNNVDAYKLRAELQLGDNGDNAKTAPVKIVALSGEVLETSYWGRFVFDLDGMEVEDKIPLDYAHDDDNSIGYLNRFDKQPLGKLVVSGAIVPFSYDKGAEVVAKQGKGVPYQASIQWDSDFLAQQLDEGMSTEVNGVMVTGPLIIFRQWKLVAVAVCKFGQDSETSTELALSKNAKEIKGLWFSQMKGNSTMNIFKNSKTEIVATVEAPVEAKAVEVKAVEAVVAEVKDATKLSEEKAETTPVAVAVVEAVKPVEVVEVAKVEEPKAEDHVLSKVVDPRAEAKKFIETFGELAGVKYFALGKSMDEALAEHLKMQAKEIADLNKRLGSIDRGGQPVNFIDNEAKASKEPMKLVNMSKK